jgi:hypothetical protein
VDAELTAWEQTVYDLVHDVATNVLADGRAHLEPIQPVDATTGHAFALHPVNPRAASVRLFPAEDLDYVEVGEQASLELWQPPEERLRLLRQLLQAVLDGRFREVVQYGPENEPLSVTAVFDLDPTPWEYVRSRPPLTPRWRYLLVRVRRTSEATAVYGPYDGP